MEGKADSRITDFFPTSPKEVRSGDPEPDPLPIATPELTPTTKDLTNAKDTDIDTAAKNATTESQGPSASEKKDCAVNADGSTSELVHEKKEVNETAVDSGKKKRGRGRPRGRNSKGKKSQSTTTNEAETSQAKPASSRRSRKAKKEETPSHQLTEYFQVRRSDRKLTSDVEKQKKELLEQAILSGCEDGLKVVEFEGKGRGVVSTKTFKRGDFIVEYAGNLIDLSKAKEKEAEYSQEPDIGCYMYYFNFNNKKYCVDATAESGKLGRLLNHSKSGNCKTKVVGIGNRPYLILVAARNISIGEELLYDYGDRSKEAIAAHPWLAK